MPWGQGFRNILNFCSTLWNTKKKRIWHHMKLSVTYFLSFLVGHPIFSLYWHRYCQSGHRGVSLSLSVVEEIYRVPTFLLIDLLITLLYLYHFYPTFQSIDCFNTGAAEANLRGYPLPQAPGWGAKIGLYSFTLPHLRRSPIQVLTVLNVALLPWSRERVSYNVLWTVGL